MITHTSFGQWLKQRRKTLDMTRDELAQRIGCSASILYKIEADERRPSKQIAELLAHNLNIPPDEHEAFVRFARVETSDSADPFGTPYHPPTNLPAQLTTLIGRDDDITAIRKRLSHPDVRLLTLLGPPGIGKTQLALQAATYILEDFPAGVFFVALSPITDASLVPATLANTLGLPDIGPQTPLQRLKAFLRDKQILLILDNFEQLLAAAPQLADLLAGCPWLKLLVTSRAPLHIRTERQMPVARLALPDLANLPDLDALSRYAAVSLFIERAQAVQPAFALTSENASAVAAICTRLDGLPLAIELISARIKLLSPAMLLERLHGRLMLQSDGLRDFEPRHRTLNAAIEWSYQLLTAEEQMLFRRLGVFVGGWTLEAAETVCMENLSLNMLDGLASLLDKNLIKHDNRSDGLPRFMMLETIGEYAVAQAAVSDEWNSLYKRHFDYFLRLAEQAEVHQFGGEQIMWFDRLESDLDNLRAAFNRSVESEHGLRLVTTLGWFLSERSHSREGLDWFDRAIAANPDTSLSLRAKALHSAASQAMLLGDHNRQIALCEQSLQVARPANDRWNMAWALSHLGFFNSTTCLDESLTLFRELEDSMGITHTLYRRAGFAIGQDDHTYARLLLEEALTNARKADDKIMLGWIFHSFGILTERQNHDYAQVKLHFESSLKYFHEARFMIGYHRTLLPLARVELLMSDVDHAQKHYKEALVLIRQLQYDPWGACFAIFGLAQAAQFLGQPDRAATLLEAMSSIIPQTDQVDLASFPTFDSHVMQVRALLGETAYAKAQAIGSVMTSPQLIAYALERTH
jgi:predicted ATPase/DNA-binding XRE family transcriptional regulator